MKKALLISILGTALALTACSDPKEANKDNFAKAIQTYLDTQHAVCLNFRQTGIALSFPKDSPYAAEDKYVLEADMASYEDRSLAFLRQHGLVSRSDEIIEGRRGPFRAAIYTVTDKGRPYLSGDKLCSGKIVLESIDDFTEPADTGMGMKASHVNFTKSYKDIADWAIEANPRISTGEKISDAHDLVLTNDGWKSYNMVIKNQF
ncbi:hypothetical protein [Lonepinella sp. BR2271]|uniref:hypothetical protein n=1 Tax=Lonepinella sp. BR2271 TaxID=3434550 RepID=UPI003F6DA823